jgi:N-methylhydantoinase A
MLRILDDSVADERDDLLAQMRAEGQLLLGAAGADPATVRFRHGMDARYRGQGNEVTVWLGEGEAWPATLAESLEAFAGEYEKVYGMSIPDVPVEVVTWRISAWAPPPAIEIAELARATGTPTPGRTRRARFDRGAGPVDVPVYGRETLGAGATLSGPAFIEERETTAVIRPGWTMTVAVDGALVAVKEIA